MSTTKNYGFPLAGLGSDGDVYIDKDTVVPMTAEGSENSR